MVNSCQGKVAGVVVVFATNVSICSGVGCDDI